MSFYILLTNNKFKSSISFPGYKYNAVSLSIDSWSFSNTGLLSQYYLLILTPRSHMTHHNVITFIIHLSSIYLYLSVYLPIYSCIYVGYRMAMGELKTLKER